MKKIIILLFTLFLTLFCVSASFVSTSVIPTGYESIANIMTSKGYNLSSFESVFYQTTSQGHLRIVGVYSDSTPFVSYNSIRSTKTVSCTNIDNLCLSGNYQWGVEQWYITGSERLYNDLNTHLLANPTGETLLMDFIVPPLTLHVDQMGEMELIQVEVAQTTTLLAKVGLLILGTLLGIFLVKRLMVLSIN